MDSQVYGCIVGIAGLVYGSIGYGLSILTCIFGTVMRRFFPELGARPAPKPSRISGGRRKVQGSKSWQSRSCSKASTSKSSTAAIFEANQTLAPRIPVLKPSDKNARLRRVSSLESLDRRHSFVLIAPVITINHVDHVDNVSIKAPTITIHPNPIGQPEGSDELKSKRRSFTLAHPPSLPNLPHRQPSPPVEANRTFRFANLKPSWGNEKPKIRRSASSPYLMEFAKQDKYGLKDLCREKVQPVLSGKSSKRPLKQEKQLTPAHSQPASTSKLFTTCPKNIEKKRSQVALRTQPYNAPYFVHPPVPPIPSNEMIRDRESKRNATLPHERRERSSTSPQRISPFKMEKT